MMSMGGIKPQHDKQQFAKRGEAIFEQHVRPHLQNERKDAFVAIDIATGAYEIDANEIAACARLRTRVPEAKVWLRRVGSRFARRFGELLRGTN